jgi:hypothetical protein
MLSACALVVLGTGCGKETTVDTAKLQQDFASASGEIKENVDKAVADIKAGNYQGAMMALSFVLTKSNELSQVQLNTAGEAWTLANAVLMEKGTAASAAQSKADAAALEAQAKGSE